MDNTHFLSLKILYLKYAKIRPMRLQQRVDQLCLTVINIPQGFLSFFSESHFSSLSPAPSPHAAPELLGNTVLGLHPWVVTSINPDTNHRKPHKMLPPICLLFQCLSVKPPSHLSQPPATYSAKHGREREGEFIISQNC